MLWLNFLHLYQPSNADAHVIKEATEKSYLRLVRALEENPKIKFTLNITGCLILRWEDLGYFGLIKRIKKLVAKKQIELVGSASYHPIMPLIPEAEAIRQIKDQEEILKKYFGLAKPKGFFIPEMAYSPAIGKLIKKLGYQWLILDEIAYNGKLGQVNFNKPRTFWAEKRTAGNHNSQNKTAQKVRGKIYEDKNSGLKIIFRSRELSRSYVPDAVLKLLNKKITPQPPLSGGLAITATDAELYGLRHIDHTGEFEKLLKNKNLKTQTISEFIKHAPHPLSEGGFSAEKINPLSCNWESTEAELKNKLPYALWHDKKNKIQNNLWGLANFVYGVIEKHKKDKNYYWVRWHLVRGLASCSFWWASAKDFKLFGSISWSPDEIERGTNELIRAIRALENEKTRSEKIKAEKLYIKIKHEIWQKHWRYYWKK
jgi:hypothetical protein